VTPLAQFQDDFVRALYAQGPGEEPLPAFAAQRGFEVYRNTVLKTCIDALQANYPTLDRLVGSAWLRERCSAYVRLHRPTDVRLIQYGADFADFLERASLGPELGYLPDVARLDRMWIDVHGAADAACIDVDAVASIAPDALATTVLHVAPSARWRWFPVHPIYTIWRINREAGEWREDIAWQGEGVLMTRPDGAVRWQTASAGTCAFLDACADGVPLERAAQAATQIEPALAVDRMFAQLLTSGCFAADEAANAPSLW
jgi:hypothetical protein